MVQRIPRRSAACITLLGAQHTAPCGKLRIFAGGGGLLFGVWWWCCEESSMKLAVVTQINLRSQ